jgi:hypothetical protein
VYRTKAEDQKRLEDNGEEDEGDEDSSGDVKLKKELGLFSAIALIVGKAYIGLITTKLFTTVG